MPPRSVPINKTTGMTKKIGNSILTIEAAIAPVNANTDPTERSIPAIKITKVIPTAIIALTEVWRKIFKILSTLKKSGLIIDTIAIRIINAIKERCSIKNLPI